MNTSAMRIALAAMVVAGAVWVGGSTAKGARQQPTGKPAQFEEASVRECDPDNLPPVPEGARGGGANSFLMTPGRAHIQCMTLATIIRTAYGYGPADLDFLNPGGRGRGMNASNIPYGLGVEDGKRVRGGPDWVRSERYTIDAVAEDAADGATMSGPMLRALLERRFQLKVHIESDQVLAFALLVAQGGVKVKASAPDSCVSYPVDPTVPRVNGVPVGAKRPTLADVRRGEKRLCGHSAERNGPNQVFIGGGMTFNGLAQQLAARLGGVQVFDKTGVTGNFDWILEFVLDTSTPGAAAALTGVPQPAPAPSDIPPAPTVFVALEQQLGLKLEPARRRATSSSSIGSSGPRRTEASGNQGSEA